jgi:hypothetical protein
MRAPVPARHSSIKQIIPIIAEAIIVTSWDKIASHNRSRLFLKKAFEAGAFGWDSKELKIFLCFLIFSFAIVIDCYIFFNAAIVISNKAYLNALFYVTLVVGGTYFLAANVCFALIHVPYVLTGPFILSELGPGMKKQVRSILRLESSDRRRKIRYLRGPAIKHIKGWQKLILRAYLVGVITSLAAMIVLVTTWREYHTAQWGAPIAAETLELLPLSNVFPVLEVMIGSSDSTVLDVSVASHKIALPTWVKILIKIYPLYLFGIAFSFVADSFFYVYARLDAELLDVCSRPRMQSVDVGMTPKSNVELGLGSSHLAGPF